jgi:hypothetical protein
MNNMNTKDQARERENIQRLIESLADGVDHGQVSTFEQIVEKCRKLDAFRWRFLGNFTVAQNRSYFGKLLPRYLGTFILPGARRVEFDREGTDRARFFTIKIL